MTTPKLPQASQDILGIPEDKMPGVLSQLIDNRALTGLVQEVHREMVSPNPDLRRKAALALRHMGFVD